MFFLLSLSTSFCWLPTTPATMPPVHGMEDFGDLVDVSDLSWVGHACLSCCMLFVPFCHPLREAT